MVLATILLFIIMYKSNCNIIENTTKVIVAWAGCVYFSLEILSIFHAINTINSWIFWGGVDLVLLIISWKRRNGRAIIYQCKKQLKNVSNCWKEIVCVLVLGFITLILAIKMTPNNWDSMTYHLPRIMHWAQNGSVEHYASNSLRQITSPVLAEFVNLYVYVMYGRNDFWFNILQWGSYVLDTFLVVGITRKLKCDYKFSILAGLLFMTMPGAFAEAMTTQNDLFDAMWLLVFVYVLLDFLQGENIVFNIECIGKTVLLSFSIAFGYLTKPAIMFGIVIFAIGLLIAWIKTHVPVDVTLKLFACSLGIIVTVLAPELIRNFQSFHAFSAPIAGAQQLVGTLDIKYLFVNMLKNMFYNTPNYCFTWMAPLIAHGLYYLSYRLGIDLDAESISEWGNEFGFQTAPNFQHDTAVNTILFTSAAVLFILVIFFYKKMKLRKMQIIYCVLAVVSFVMLCVFLRWERFVTRYMIGYLALLCPMVAVILYNMRKSDSLRKIYCLGVSVIIFLSFVEVVNMTIYHVNESLYADGIRETEYFHNWKETKYVAYRDIADYIKDNNIEKIGILMTEDTYEYPLWGMLRGYDCQIEHVKVDNLSGKYEDLTFQPDCIFVYLREDDDTIYYHGAEYTRIDVGDYYTYLMEKVE